MADFADGSGHFLGGGGNLVGLAGLRVGVAGALYGAGADLGGGGGEGFRALRNGLEHRSNGGNAGVQGYGKTADLIAT